MQENPSSTEPLRVQETQQALTTQSKQHQMNDTPATDFAKNEEHLRPDSGHTPSDTGIYSEDERYLLGLADKGYTLQWLGVSSLAAAESFRAKHPLKNQMRIYQRRSQQKPLYLIVSGQFNSAVDAENTKAIYQKREYRGTPWVKPLAKIKSEISAK